MSRHLFIETTPPPPKRQKLTLTDLKKRVTLASLNFAETEAQPPEESISDSESEDDQIVSWNDTEPAPNQEDNPELSLPDVVPLSLRLPSRFLEKMMPIPAIYVDSSIPSSLTNVIPETLAPFISPSGSGRVEIDYLAYEKSLRNDLGRLLATSKKNYVYLEALYKSQCPELDASPESEFRDLLQFKRVSGREAEQCLTGACDLCDTPFLYSKMTEFVILRPAVVQDRIPVSFAQTNILANQRGSQLARTRPCPAMDICCASCLDCFDARFTLCPDANRSEFSKELEFCHSKIEGKSLSPYWTQ